MTLNQCTRDVNREAAAPSNQQAHCSQGAHLCTMDHQPAATMANLVPDLHQELLKVFQSAEYKKIHNDLNVELQKRLMERIHIVESRCTALETENENLKRIIRLHDEEINELKQRTHTQEKESKRNNLQIMGLKEEKDENTKEKVRTFLEENLKVKVRPENIVAAERVGLMKKELNPRPRKIVIKFNNVWVKREIYRERLQLKELQERVFINEDLTKETYMIFQEARKLMKEKMIYTVFTQDGVVYIKKDREGRKIRIPTLERLAYFTESSSSSNDSDMSLAGRQRMELSVSMTKSDSVTDTGNANVSSN